MSTFRKILNALAMASLYLFLSANWSIKCTGSEGQSRAPNYNISKLLSPTYDFGILPHEYMGDVILHHWFYGKLLFRHYRFGAWT